MAAALESVDVSALGEVEVREFVRAADQMVSWAQGIQAKGIAEIARRTGESQAQRGLGLPVPQFLDDPFRFVADEVAIELNISHTAASHRVGFALNVQSRPATVAALMSGRIDRSKADLIVEQLSHVESEEFVEVLEQAAIEYAEAHTRPQLRAWLRRRIMAVEPEHAERRRKAAREERRIQLFPGDDGMSTLYAELPSEDALAIYRTVDQIAHASCASAVGALLDADSSGQPVPRVTTDGRTLDQRRADAFTDLLLSRTTTGGSTDKTPAVSEVQVVVPLETLAGVSKEPGELVGYGPITAEHARALADSDSRWRRLLTDATGSVVEVAPQTYKPGNALDRFVKARDLVCRFPGCRRSAVNAAAGTPNRVDLDHTVPFPQGPTVPENLAALCRSHHLLKTHGDWRVQQDHTGILTWTTPSGRRFRTHPNDYRPSTAAATAPTDQRSGAPPDQQAA